MKMTKNEIAAIKADLANVLADWYLDKDITKYYNILCNRIVQLNEFIELVPDDKQDSAGYRELILLCYHFYKFRDNAT
jgi:hypothetical protein